MPISRYGWGDTGLGDGKAWSGDSCCAYVDQPGEGLKTVRPSESLNQ
jgi:hypothetical protein